MLLADNSIERLTKAIEHNYAKMNIRTVLELISTKARLLYTYNQEYRDEQSEDILSSFADMYQKGFSHGSDEKTVLFYDGFGLDSRGLVQQYLSGLIENNFRVWYVTAATDRLQQPQVVKILEKGRSEFVSVKGVNISDKIAWLRNFCASHRFNVAFMYTTPWDVAGIVLFNMLKGRAIRYQINLTDHAFWLGAQAFDYCIEFRNYGAAITRDYRRVDENRLLYLPYYPIVNERESFHGFPELCQNKKVIFSGGAPYKTVDTNNTFYKLIEAILNRHNDVAFLYAGNGTVNGLDSLVKKYPEKVMHIPERSDLIEVMKHSRLFLNTYPISGALMLQYAAIAECIPVTLKREWDDDADGLLKNEKVLQETFTDFSRVIEEIDRLLEDEDYYLSKKKMLKGQVITPPEFTKQLKQILENPKMVRFTRIEAVDTHLYRKTFAENLTRKDVLQNIIQKGNTRVWRYFPDLLIERIFNKVKL